MPSSVARTAGYVGSCWIIPAFLSSFFFFGSLKRRKKSVVGGVVKKVVIDHDFLEDRETKYVNCFYVQAAKPEKTT